MSDILTEMEILREYCTLIKRSRKEMGITSEKYPLFTVWVNHYFTPAMKQLIANECNFIGYMDIPPVEYLDQSDMPDGTSFSDGNMQIVIDKQTGHPMQEEMHHARTEARTIAEARKKAGLRYDDK